MREQILTQSNLKQMLFYSIITGQFYWIKPNSNRVKEGDKAGCTNTNGYRHIRVYAKVYLAHRLAWFWVTGEWPNDEIDHKNLTKTDNQWLNLREANRSENSINRKIQPNNTSGYKGVAWDKKTKKWRARINQNTTIGYYANCADAVDARLKAEKELHGDFANQSKDISSIRL